MLDPNDKGRWQQEALGRRVKYTRILRRKVRGKTRYAQLVQEGLPPTKGRVTGQGVVGLDIGPSTIASFSMEQAILEPFCPTVTQPWKELRTIERALDRSRRATNPSSARRERDGQKRTEKMETLTAFPKTCCEAQRTRKAAGGRAQAFAHGQLANRILAQGKTVKTEKLSSGFFSDVSGEASRCARPVCWLARWSEKQRRQAAN